MKTAMINGRVRTAHAAMRAVRVRAFAAVERAA
jgi:hypothetical protein